MDTFKNFAKVTVSTGYDASATSVVLSSGHAARLPSVPFNATWWNSTDYPDPSDDPNVEIVRVTAIVTDTLTVTRAQESISASTKNTSGKTYKMIAGLTAKTLNADVNGAFAQISTGRLTLESGVPISTTDQTAKTTIYFAPFRGNRIALYDGSEWNVYAFSELSLALGTLTANKNYDVFVYNNAGTLTLEFSAAWTSNILRADALTLQDGIYVKSGALTRRYVGTFYTDSATTTQDSLTDRLVWNYYNRAARDLYKGDMTSHSYTGGSRIWNGDASNRVAFVQGLAEDSSIVCVDGDLQSVGGVFVIVGAALDVTDPAYRSSESYMKGITSHPGSSEIVTAQIGYHVLNLIQRTFGGGGDFAGGFITAQVFG